jgi:hypothetical protein
VSRSTAAGPTTATTSVNDGTKFSVMPAAINNRFDTWVGGAEKSSDDEASDDGVVHEPAKVVSGTSGRYDDRGCQWRPRLEPHRNQPAPQPPARCQARRRCSTVVEAADTGAPPEGKQIKAGWKMALSSSSKRYWYNRASGETSWVFPAEGESCGYQTCRPAGSRRRRALDRRYFYNTTTKETRWTRPIALQSSGTRGAAGARGKSAARDAAPDEDDLPSGWKQAVSAKNNRVYYFAPATGETSWTKPTAPVNTAAAERLAAGEVGQRRRVLFQQQGRDTMDDAPTASGCRAMKREKT